MTQGRNSGHQSTHRRWKVMRGGLGKIVDHPRTSLAIGVLGVAATIATFILSEAGSSTKHPKDTMSTSSAHRQSSEAPEPGLSSDASCRDFRETASRGQAKQLPIDSPGQIDGGDGLRARILPNGSFRSLINVSVGSEVEVSALLHNSAYSSADDVSVSASISAEGEGCWRIIVTASGPSFPGDHPQLGPSLIRLKHASPAALEYVMGSTSLLDERRRILSTDLRDGVTRGGISLPYAVPGGSAYFLDFRVRIKGRRRQITQSSGERVRQNKPSVRDCGDCAMGRSVFAL